MFGTAVVLAATLCAAEPNAGVEYGWQPLPGGGLQYIIQLTPETVEILRGGLAAESDIPANLKDIRSFQIRIGTGKLVRQDPPEKPAAPPPVAEPKPLVDPEREKPLKKADPLKAEKIEKADKPEKSVFPPPRRPGGFTPPQPEPGSKSPLSLPGGRRPSDDGFPPSKLPPNPETKPVQGASAPGQATQAGFLHETGRPSLPEGDDKQSPGDSKPWLPFTVALAALCGSVSGNVYLGWLFWETRRRYLRAIRRE